MCSKVEGIFKHIGLTTWTHAYVCMECHGILIPKKNSKTHETLVDAMSCHQDDVVKKLACLTKVWTHTPHKPEQLTRRLVVPRGTQCMFDDEREIASSYGLQIFSTSNVHYYNCNVKFWKILRVI